MRGSQISIRRRSTTQGESAGPVNATTAAQPEWERQPKAARGMGRVGMPGCQWLEDRSHRDYFEPHLRVQAWKSFEWKQGGGGRVSRIVKAGAHGSQLGQQAAGCEVEMRHDHAVEASIGGS